MTHWELEAAADAFREKNGVKPAIAPPTDEEFDAWIAKRDGKDQKPSPS